MIDTDVVVVGGGAAGLMCALVAGQRGRRVVVLEGANRIGKKILMSGGGRCNFTNLHCEPAHFVSSNPRFCISALSRYTQWDFIALVDKHQIAWHEKTLGQLFCDHSSKDIVAMLEDECRRANVQILTNSAITEIGHDQSYTVASAHGRFRCASLVIASGGLSIPKMGASDFGYQVARQFGLRVLDTRAGLVPFTFTGATHALTERLSGVSVAATVTADNVTFTENILFTHRGMSGPAVLQASSYWEPGRSVFVNILPTLDVEAMLLRAKHEQPKVRLRSVLAEYLPRALVLELQGLFWPQHANTPLVEMSDSALRTQAQRLSRWELKPAATEGYRTAEVTLGGVDTTQLSSRTMECADQPGLFFVGEVVDVTGHLGGFNFQWAWASGHAAGEVV